MSRQRGTFLDTIKSIFLWIVMVLITAFILIVASPFIAFKISNIVHKFAILWGKGLAHVSGIHITVENKEKIHRDGPVIVVSNHQSLFDILVFYSFLDIQFRWMAKASLFKIPFFGWGMSGAGYIPVERGEKKKAQKSLFAAAERIKKGASVIIFPEGTRGHVDGTMLPFKRGGFILAKKAEVVLQPVTIWGANQIVPIQKNAWIQRLYSGRVYVVVHDPIFPEEYRDMPPDELSDKLRAILERPMDRLRAVYNTLK